MMSLLLPRLPAGRRGKYAVLGLWILLIVVAGPLAARLSEVQDNDQLSALPAGAEAKAAQDRVAAAFPTSDALVAVAVYARQGGLTEADRAKAEQDRSAFARYAVGGRIDAPVASDDGAALLLSFPLAGDRDAQSDASKVIRDGMSAGAPAGLRTALTGSAGADSDIFDAFDGMDGTLLLATAVAVALLLIVSYRSPVLWLIPLLVVGVASQIADAVVYLLARHGGLTVDFQSQSILTVLVFGVGVDYALLLLSRYREELRQRPDRHAAMAVALRRAVPPILGSAATVAIGLLCLLAADLPSTRGLGPVGAVGILTALVAMTTLLPAIMVLCGRWIFWPFVPRVGQTAGQHRIWRRIATVVARRPRPVWIGTALVLVGLMLGIGLLRVGLPGDESFTKEVGSVTGQHLLERHYPAGAAAPADIIAASASGERVAEAARGVRGVAEVGPAQRSADGRWVRMSAVLTDPAESDAAHDTIARLRTALHAVPGGQALVGGDPAADLDADSTAERDTWVVLPLILAVIFIILVVLLRSLVAPVLLLASVVLSYAAAMGAAGLILSALGHPRLWVSIPLQTFLFLVALGVDYTIFLMTRAREEVTALGHAEGIRRAVVVTGGVITSAGVVLAATFAALSVLPLVPSVQMAVIGSVGVLIDTFLVRTLLVPALVLHVGPVTWWPGRAGRRPAPGPVVDAEAVPVSWRWR